MLAQKRFSFIMPSTTSVCCCVTDRKDTAGTSSVSWGCCTSALGALAFCIAKGLPSTTPYLLSSPSSVSSHPAALAMFPRASGAVPFPCFSHAVVLMLLFLQPCTCKSLIEFLAGSHGKRLPPVWQTPLLPPFSYPLVVAFSLHYRGHKA